MTKGIVAVLGAGPAGLIAAHQAALLGYPVAVLTAAGPSGRPEPSKLGGAQFLHEPVPIVNDNMEPTMVSYHLEGSVEGYSRKVYGGDLPPGVAVPVSMTNLYDGMQQPAWNLVETYRRLWDLLEPCIQVQEVTSEYLAKTIAEERFHTIFNSVPAPALCVAGHQFGSQNVTIANECIIDSLPDNVIFYSGDKDRSWYRCSRLWGVGGTEWGDGVRPPLKGLVSVTKPLRTNCTCWLGDVVRVGRFGTWTKGILVNDSMRIVKEVLGAV